MNDAFRKETVTLQLTRCWPLLISQFVHE